MDSITGMRVGGRLWQVVSTVVSHGYSKETIDNMMSTTPKPLEALRNSARSGILLNACFVACMVLVFALSLSLLWTPSTSSRCIYILVIVTVILFWLLSTTRILLRWQNCPSICISASIAAWQTASVIPTDVLSVLAINYASLLVDEICKGSVEPVKTLEVT